MPPPKWSNRTSEVRLRHFADGSSTAPIGCLRTVHCPGSIGRNPNTQVAGQVRGGLAGNPLDSHNVPRDLTATRTERDGVRVCVRVCVPEGGASTSAAEEFFHRHSVVVHRGAAPVPVLTLRDAPFPTAVRLSLEPTPGSSPPSRGGLAGLAGMSTRPARVPQRWGSASCREVAPLTCSNPGCF
jgi:hypothetical protein